MMDFALKMTDLVLNMMNFAFKMMNSVFKMMNLYQPYGCTDLRGCGGAECHH